MDVPAVDNLSMQLRRSLVLGSHGTKPVSDVQNVAKASSPRLWLTRMVKSTAKVAMPRILDPKGLALGRELEPWCIPSEDWALDIPFPAPNASPMLSS